MTDQEDDSSSKKRAQFEEEVVKEFKNLVEVTKKTDYTLQGVLNKAGFIEEREKFEEEMVEASSAKREKFEDKEFKNHVEASKNANYTMVRKLQLKVLTKNDLKERMMKPHVKRIRKRMILMRPFL